MLLDTIINSVKFDTRHPYTPSIKQINMTTVLSSFLRIVDPSTPCADMPATDDLACQFKYPLDPFQQHAVKAIHKGENVLVTAKTGSGKTLVGEYLIHHCLKKGGRVFYTTPIKSLSNQKFHDLKSMFPSVGIMTGDIKYKPDAQIVIMTTEILRNLLYKQGSVTASIGLTASISLDGLAGVVFDEVHYINDKERGKVWEETMILLDRTVQQVLLSATIDRPELFASWLGELKQVPIHLISTTYRIVPLNHQIFLGQHPRVIMDNKEIFNDAAYKEWLDWRFKKVKAKEQHQRAVAGRRAGGYQDPVIKDADAGLPAFPQQMNDCVKYLHTHDLLPAIFFVFSRAGCERFANMVEGSLIDSSATAAITHIWNFHLHRYKDILEHLPQAHALLALVKRGIAYHHSGILPILREMIEILFGKGLLKVLFATETFAVGINMPTKTVVFLDVKKYSDDGLRLLRTDEYTQMAGRAGRRGMDSVGHVFYLPQRDPVELGEMKSMLTGKKSAITSRMEFDYDFILKTLHSGNKRWMDIIGKSYWYQQREAEKAGIRVEIRTLHTKIEAAGLAPVYREGCAERIRLEECMKISVNAARKAAQREYDSLKNKQIGPAWAKAEIAYKDILRWEGEIRSLDENLRALEEIGEDMLGPNLQLLHMWGFLEGDEHALTKLGILATEINEGHPILMSKAFLDGLCHEFDHASIGAFLAAFMNEGKKDNDSAPNPNNLAIPDDVKAALWEMDAIAGKYQAEEDKNSATIHSNDFWRLDTTWIEPVYRWIEGEDAAVICRDYEIYEGNLMRSLLKVANMVEEWTNCAVFCQETEMLAKLEGLKEKIIRGIARPESLYLTL